MCFVTSKSSPCACILFGDKRMACADFLENRDNIDCRRIGHLTPHKVQTMELAKNVKTHNSQFGLCANNTSFSPT